MNYTEQDLLDFVCRATTHEKTCIAMRWIKNHVKDEDLKDSLIDLLFYRDAYRTYETETDPTGYITIDDDSSIDLTLLYNQTCAF